MKIELSQEEIVGIAERVADAVVRHLEARLGPLLESPRTNPKGGEVLLTDAQAAERLGLSNKTLARWRWSGQGPRYRKFGSAVRYSEADLAAFIEQSVRRHTSDPGPEAMAQLMKGSRRSRR